MTLSKFTGKVIWEWWESESHEKPKEFTTVERTRYVSNFRWLGESDLYYCDYLVYKYSKIDNVIMLEENIPVKFVKDSFVEINGDVVVIEKVIYHLDGSITYETDKVIEKLSSSDEEAEKKSKDECMERLKKMKEEKMKEENEKGFNEKGFNEKGFNEKMNSFKKPEKNWWQRMWNELWL